MKTPIRLIAMALCLILLFSAAACAPADDPTVPTDPTTPSQPEIPPGGDPDMIDLSALKVNASEIPLKIWYDEQAPFINEGSPEASMMAGQDIGWQNWSLPIGNGFFGANVFGRVETERIQISEKTLSNPWQKVQVVNGVTSWPQVAGLNNFSETYIDFDHSSADISNYRRELDLRTAIASVQYDYNGASYSREHFVSYPDKALVIRLDAQNGPLSFTLRPTIPFEQSYMDSPDDGMSKSGTVVASVENGVGCIELSGTMGYYDVDFVGYYRVYTNGGTMVSDTVEHRYTDADGKPVTDTDGVIRVDGATSAIIVATFGTDYELCAQNFETGQYSHQKQTSLTDLDDARQKVSRQFQFVTDEIDGMTVDEAYDYLKSRHLSDYQELFDRVDLNINCDTADLSLPTDSLLAAYNNGNHSTYLDSLLFQYGRYLIIASSREGSLPANLQGVWNCYNVPAWTSGYWSNINIQMNYWHVFSTNLKETFTPYVDYNQAYMSVAEKNANNVIAQHNPSMLGKDGGNGWTMGVSGNPFFISSDRSCGNLGLLTQLFYDYYEFTKDEAVLQTVYDILANAARFVTKCVKNYDGIYLVEHCDSPEMYVDGAWYYTTGTAYAQTLAYMNNYGALKCAQALGIDLTDTELLSSEEYSILRTVMEQLDHYDPIHIGLSGQIKEFREEDYYGSMGNPNHRHISQLVGLFPGNIIHSGTAAWLDAALVSIDGRNTGLTDWPNGTTNTNEASIVAWAWAHKQALYARAGEGDKALEMLAGNLRNSTLENLLMVCGKIFQIEASSGTTAAIAEMLLQSDEEFIEILPALPSAWSSGAYTGLVARGNYEVSVAWEDSVATKINVLSKNGGRVSVKYPEFAAVSVYDADGQKVEFEISDDKVITFDTQKGGVYYITGFEKTEKVEKPTGFGFERLSLGDFKLTWNAVTGAEKYNIYIAYENDAEYTFIGSTSETAYDLKVEAGRENVRKTFVVTAVNNAGTESKRSLCYSNPIALELVLYHLSWNTADGKINATASASESAGSARLYEKSAETGQYVLVAESKDMSVSADYDAAKAYALSIVSKYTGEESALTALTHGNNENNLVGGKEFISTEDALKAVMGIHYGYATLTDGKAFSSDDGRFATVNNGSFEATVDLEAVYALDELRLYLYNGIAFAGNDLKVERLYEGQWHTVVSCTTNEEIAAYLCDGAEPYLSIDLQQEKAHKLRITISSCVEGKCISFHEITLAGSKVSGEPVHYTNVFAGKEFVPSNQAAGNMYQAAYGYQTLTDGIIYNEHTGRYSSRQNGGKVEATIDLGAPHNLSELKIYLYKEGLSKFGTGLEIQVYFGGKWQTVVSCASVSALERYLVDNAGGTGDWLVFNLGDVYASKVRFTIPGQTESGWTTFYEMECSGTPSTVTEPDPGPAIDPEPVDNVFAGKLFVPTAEADAQVLRAAWFKGGGYETLTDRNKVGEQTGRFSTLMNNTSTFMDSTIDLRAGYELGILRFYLYDTQDSITEESKKASIGKDLLIQVYANGAWTDVITCADNASLCKYLVINEGLNNDYLEFDLGGIVAEKVRFVISGAVSTNGITFQEIECSGVKVYAGADETPETGAVDNVFAGKAFRPTAEAEAQVLRATWFQGGGYETLTDGNKFGEQVGRFSTLMNNTTAFMDATIDLGKTYQLNTLKFYLYDTKASITTESKKASIGTDLLIQVYANGAWTDVITCADNASLCKYLVINEGLNNDYLEFDLSGITAEKVRFFISGAVSTNGITFQEIECSGAVAEAGNG